MAHAQVTKIPDPKIAPWNDSWNKETVRLAFEESASSRDVVSALADSMDNKVVAIFSVASAIIGLTPALRGDEAISVERAVTFAISVLAWGVAVIQCYRAYQTHDFIVGPNPNKALDAKWLRLAPEKYQYYAIAEMGRAHEVNAAHILRRGKLLSAAMVATVVEVLSLGLAFLVF
jgi:hypothetical protein